MMTDRYTPEARRAIVFAHHVSRHDAAEIGTEHLLWGLMREHPAFVNRFLTNKATVESLWEEVLGEIKPEMISSARSVELRFSTECQRAISSATEEADRAGQAYIGIDHLLLGLMHEYGSNAERILRGRGANLERVRSELAADPYLPMPQQERARIEVKNILDALVKASRQTSADADQSPESGGTSPDTK
jgi:ATP-dependent Clp protease ATP-binding subunit ClpC